jgi:hypothetical protein
MSDIVYTKSQILSRKHKGMQWELHPAMTEALELHIEVMHSKQDVQRWSKLFVEVVICESDYWPMQAQISDELPPFLKSIRQGDIKVYSGAVGAYSEAYREFKSPKALSNFAYNNAGGANAVHDSLSIPQAILSENYAPEWEQCFSKSHDGEWKQVKRCLRDVLEGIEASMVEGHIARGTDTDTYLRKRYRDAERLWERLTGSAWVRLANVKNRNRFLEAM